MRMLAKPLRIYVIPCMLSCLMTFVVCWLALGLSRNYYMTAPFHFDSASYRLNSINIHSLIEQQGLLSTLPRLIKSPNDFDVLLRAVFFPDSLTWVHGHLVVLAVFLALFLFLMAYTVYEKTKSFANVVIILLAPCIFPQMYRPFQGIADYWKDNIATWIVGCLIFCMIRSDKLRNKKWSVTSGFAFGLLIMQRPAIAVYIAVCSLPFMLFQLWDQLRKDEFKAVTNRFAYPLAPVLLIGGTAIILQGKALHDYYFKAGYDYSTMQTVALSVTLQIIANSVLLIICFLISLLSVYIKQKTAASLIQNYSFAHWLSCLFPLTIIVSTGNYHSFGIVYMVIMVSLLSMVIVNNSTTLDKFRIIRMMVITLFIALSIRQYWNVRSLAEVAAKQRAPSRQVDEKLAEIFLNLPEPRRLILAYDEKTILFKNFLYFSKRARKPDEQITFVGHTYIHDSYYWALLNTISAEEVVKTNIRLIEAHPGTIAVAFDDVDSLSKSGNFKSDGQHVALPAALALHDYLHNSRYWKVIATVNSPQGILNVYRFSGRS